MTDRESNPESERPYEVKEPEQPEGVGDRSLSVLDSLDDVNPGVPKVSSPKNAPPPPPA